MSSGVRFAARLSLSFLWIFTAITSAFFAKEIGYQVLAGRGITGGLASFCILSGSLLNAVIGIWLLTGKSLRLCYLAQLVVISAYTLLLTVIAPGFWLHPFGPVTKNIPLLVLIYCLYREA
ncbi:DoxX-like family protein [Alkalimonas mucilaginosa]|uniref:DoxX-like family protein n=1 Tax=Alkalimonas mucilaginosa TaxID=3057676 RepID=A0ABU7JAF6_9GAMM|nr:DoxX-like family protein [Alkalimonas sp. MEB004]MEE2022678.1 DoxX-like family protein [Alkalimonas sp. MEB004]